MRRQASSKLGSAAGNGRQPWQRGEPIDNGRRARCSRAPCQRGTRERHIHLMGEACLIASKSMKVPAKAHRWGASPREKVFCLVCPLTKSPRNAFTASSSNYPLCPMGAPFRRWLHMVYLRNKITTTSIETFRENETLKKGLEDAPIGNCNWCEQTKTDFSRSMKQGHSPSF